MPAPIVSWYDSENESELTQWDIGTIDAGTVSDETTVLIWNNRNGDEDVSKMENCTITTKDEDGGNTGELVEDTWIEVKVDSMGEDDFTSIGGDTTKEIEAGGSNAGSQEILGDSNDGSMDDDDNYAEVTLRADVPSNASAGNIDFLTRVSYQYT